MQEISVIIKIIIKKKYPTLHKVLNEKQKAASSRSPRITTLPWPLPQQMATKAQLNVAKLNTISESPAKTAVSSAALAK